MKIKIVFFSLGVFIIISLIYFFSNILSGQKHTPPQPISFSQDYSNLNKIIPGQSTMDDVKKINGIPLSFTNKNGLVYFYYQTPSVSLKNFVIFKNGVEIIAYENVFGGYRGDYNTFLNAYGKPDFTLYKKGSSYYGWRVFLSSGLGVETDGKDILVVIYFKPQNKDSFMQNVAGEIDLVDNFPRERF